ncbi:MAG: DoxX family protein [Ferruginibacter sp.]
MGLLQKIQSWTSAHNPKWLALVRVGLGVALLLRGVNFMNNHMEFERLVGSSKLASASDILTTAIPWIHVVGGFLIITGIFTRFAALLQIPILLGAIFFINLNGFSVNKDLGYAIIILILLIVFVIEGSGTLSLAYYFKEIEEEEAEELETSSTTE